MSDSCILDAFTRPAPPGREGFQRDWIYEFGQAGLWKYVPQPRSTSFIWQGISVIDEEMEGGLPHERDLIWDAFHETWVPPNTPEYANERNVYYQWLYRLHGRRPRIALQLETRHENFQSYFLGRVLDNPIVNAFG